MMRLTQARTIIAWAGYRPSDTYLGKNSYCLERFAKSLRLIQIRIIITWAGCTITLQLTQARPIIAWEGLQCTWNLPGQEQSLSGKV